MRRLVLLILLAAPAHAMAAVRPPASAPASAPHRARGVARPPHRASGTAGTVDSASVERTRIGQLAFADAMQLEERGDLRAAIGAYRAVVRSDSGYPEANYRMGRLLAALDRLPDAARSYSTELRFHPAHVAARRELGLALARLGQSREAVRILEQLAHAQPTDDQAWQALGFAYSVAGRRADAETALRRAISYAPDRASEHRDLGVLLASAGRENDAREEYRAAIALDDADPATWTNLGNLEARSGHWTAALEAYRTSEARDSSYALAVQGQIVAFDSMGDREAAAATARRWLRARPDDHRARLDAVSRYHELGKDALALAIARDGVARNPSSGDAHVVLSSLLDAQSKPRDALRELRTAARLFKDPLNRGQARKMALATMAALPESLRVLARRDSIEDEEKIRERRR